MNLDLIINGSFPDFSQPLCKGSDRILVLDVDGVLLSQISTKRNGREGRDRYRVSDIAGKVIHRAKKDHFDKLIIWSASQQSVERLTSANLDLSPVDYFIAGSEIIDDFIVKDLMKITGNIYNVFAIEDDSYFRPSSKSFRITHNNCRSFWRAYEKAVCGIHF